MRALMPLWAVVGTSLFAGTAIAEHGHDHSTRGADAHVHGVAGLAVAADGQELAIELQSPMYNIVGFEHAPKTDEQRAALASARQTLSDGAALFELTPAAKCSLTSARSTLAGAHETGDAHDGHDDHHHGHHDHGHDHAHHDDHGGADDHGDHDDDDDHGHKDSHSDVTATYRFECAAPGALRSIRVGLFTAFENLETVEASYLGTTKQTAADLTADRPIFDLS